MTQKKYITIILVFISVHIFFFSSCKKFLDVGAPDTSMNAENVYQYDNTATAVLTGLYAKMMSGDFTSGGITSISLLTDLSADNLVLFDFNKIDYLPYYQNSLSADYFNAVLIGNYFINFYPRIYTINAAIEGVNKSQSLTPSVKQRVLGEAYFLRAFYYFYLVNIYGEIPLALTTDYTITGILPKSSTKQVYNQIYSDLQSSINLLDDNYVDASLIKTTTERVRPNKSTAIALLARAALFSNDYPTAESSATLLIDKKNLYDTLPLNQVFKKNSKETIWSLQPVKTGYNTDEGATFLLTSAPAAGTPKVFYASASLMKSFEQNDNRKSAWTGSVTSGGITYPFAAKYKIDANTSSVSEYNIVFRISEQYLIRSEARAQQNNITGALSDLNIIRNRAGLPLFNTNDINQLKNAILKERRVELFTEWGHRWMDLKRSNTIDNVMSAEEISKGGNWATYKALYPIPNSEIIKDKNLTQNPGY
ncbi:RagB/SusD family nutrient uptake outer membrane protein [Chitinophaga sp. HK235]|uniref:RagB/SusD family nutrient uptake outer membrane protein n=1 Tax=Chitinophaga sp. HK235 TaxID=2952571 RepID=UPI001BAB5603|nr:RagB/SusD family nutrient uptake outer membrane protein [Chitinophaga sp. HK235]